MRHDILLLSFGFNLELRRYIKAIVRVNVTRAHRQGLTLVHFSAQPEPFIVTNSTHIPIVSHITCLR